MLTRMMKTTWSKVQLFLSILALLVFWNSQARAEADCTIRRQMVTDHGLTVYVVGPRAPTLYMISRDLYGHEKNWRHIARWNNLQAPYHLEVGQHLIIKVPPRLDEAEANKVLIRAWVKLDEFQTVHRLSGNYLQSNLSCNQEDPPPERVPAETPAEGTGTEVPTTVVAAESNTETPAKADATTSVTQSKIEDEESSHRHWRFKTAAVSSMSRLKSKAADNSVNNTLYSKIDYGGELEVELETSEDLSFWLGGGIETLEMEEADGGEIELEQEYVLNYSLGTKYHLAHPLAISLAAHYVQRPFARPTTEGVDIDTVYVPEFTLGTDLRLFNFSRSQIWLFGEALTSLKTKDSNHDIDLGFGYSFGLNFDFQVNDSVLSITPAYFFLKQDTKTAKNDRESGILTIGIVW